MKPFETFTELLEHASAHFGPQIAFSIFNEKQEKWNTISFNELKSRSAKLASGLIQAGVLPGTKIALLGEPSISWIVTFYASLLSGATVIPLDIKLTSSEIKELIQHSEPSLLFVSENFLELGRELRYLNSDSTVKLFQFENEWPVSENSNLEINLFKSLEGETEVAVLCYTSGTIGQPKGVMVRRSSLLFEAESLHEIKSEPDGTEVAFSILPFNHIYGLTTGLICSVRNGFELCIPHAMTPDAIRFCLKTRKVNQIVAVPLYLKVVMNAILGKVEEKGKAKKWMFDLCLNLSPRLNSKAFVNYAFKEIHKNFDGHLRKFTCGGASLPDEIFDFFKAINIPTYVGYGLTETSPVITVNNQANVQRGSVGKAIPGVEVKISDQGEILTRGPHLMKGYYKNPELTAEMIDEDGWLHTGDIGSMDENGFVRISGRNKALIVLASGKKVHPEEVESVISLSPLVRFAGVVGIKDESSQMGEQVIAVVQPPDDVAAKYIDKPEVLNAMVLSDIHKLSKNLVDYKRPGKVLTWRKGMPLNSAMKVKRKELQHLLEKDQSQPTEPRL